MQFYIKTTKSHKA